MIAEPSEDTILCWFDPNDDPHAVFHRTDKWAESADDVARWYPVDAGYSDQEPLTWTELLEEMDKWRGPVELISNGRLEPS